MGGHRYGWAKKNSPLLSNTSHLDSKFARDVRVQDVIVNVPDASKLTMTLVLTLSQLL